MVNRIKKVISLKNFSLSRFADHIGVQRATISHILSGRNKASLEVVQKILDAFPEISAEWLVKGNGNMTKSAPNLFSDFESVEQMQPYTERKSLDEPPHGNKEEEQPSEKEEKEEKTVEKSAKASEPYQEEINNQYKITAEKAPGNTKTSTRIIIMYSDGTYSEHLPVEQT